MSAPAFVLTEDDYRAAERAWRQGRNEDLSAGELAAELDQWRRELALLRGDLESGDFSDLDEATIRGGIAYAEHRLGELVRTGERVLRARTGSPASRLVSADLKARFAAAKLVDVVDLAQTLTGEEARKSTSGRYRIRCPFHDDRTPSLVIYEPGKGWHCFVCNTGGDAVAFVSEMKKIPAVEALRLVESLCDLGAA